MAARYLHFLAALAVASAAGLFGAANALFILSLPGTDYVDMGLVWYGLIPAGVLATLAFWVVGVWPPLRAPVLRTALSGLMATLATGGILYSAAQIEWLTADVALFLSLTAVATLGFLPFARDPQRHGRSAGPFDHVPWSRIRPR